MSKIEYFDKSGNSRGYYSTTNRVNDLTGKEWLFWTRSVITKVYPPNLQHNLRRRHGGQKPPDLCADLIKVFTKKGERVLDPYMGVGGTLLGAAIAGRKALGIEINSKWINIYRDVCRLEGLNEFKTISGDCKIILRDMLKDKGREGEYDMVLTDVPYWNMDRVERSMGTYKKVGEEGHEVKRTKLSVFNDEEGGTFKSKDDWLNRVKEVIDFSSGLLKRNKYILIFIGDMYYKGRYHCLSAELADKISEIEGLVWKANIVWYDVSKKLHLYGYQYSYIPSMIHQNILVFRKEK
ncbi:MAG: class I SAM-dependent methyltransferase [Spirochaetes bacterium]|nr:MAG: class I SAM-dependent methyltransferase [Spirochaetota bacterium]